MGSPSAQATLDPSFPTCEGQPWSAARLLFPPKGGAPDRPAGFGHVSLASRGPVYSPGVTGSGAMTEPSPVELLRPADLAAGVPYAYAATTRGRALCVFTAGACPLDGSASTVARGDVRAQADQVMANLRTVPCTRPERGSTTSSRPRCTSPVATARISRLSGTSYTATSGRTNLLTPWSVSPSSAIPTSSSRWRPSRRSRNNSKDGSELSWRARRTMGPRSAHVSTNVSRLNRIEAQFRACAISPSAAPIHPRTDHRSHEEQNLMIRDHICAQLQCSGQNDP